MKKCALIKRIGCLIIMLLVSAFLVGCTNSSKVYENTNEPDYTQEALDILNSTSFMDSIDPSYVDYGLCSDITFGALLSNMFEDPQIEVSVIETSDGQLTGYDVTISGIYRDDPEGYYINEGSASITINIVNGTCNLNGDHYFKSAAEYFAFSVTGFY